MNSSNAIIQDQTKILESKGMSVGVLDCEVEEQEEELFEHLKYKKNTLK